jgi:hypothetical protein
MRAILSCGAAALIGFGFTLPAPAQMMCAPGQQAQTQGQAPSSGQAGMMMGGMAMGGMCGMMGQRTADDPMADNPANPPQRQGMMCPCCRNMSMMRPQQPAQPQQPGQQQR